MFQALIILSAIKYYVQIIVLVAERSIKINKHPMNLKLLRIDQQKLVHNELKRI